MYEFNLDKREEDFLKLNIGEETFLIPLATSLTVNEALSVDTMDGAIDFFRKYIREEVADTLTLFNYRDIIKAWRDASEKAMKADGITPGES